MLGRLGGVRGGQSESEWVRIGQNRGFSDSEGLKDEDENQSEAYRNKLGGLLVDFSHMILIFLLT